MIKSLLFLLIFISISMNAAYVDIVSNFGLDLITQPLVKVKEIVA
jgi:hypothetical protein